MSEPKPEQASGADPKLRKYEPPAIRFEHPTEALAGVCDGTTNCPSKQASTGVCDTLEACSSPNS